MVFHSEDWFARRDTFVSPPEMCSSIFDSTTKPHGETPPSPTYYNLKMFHYIPTPRSLSFKYI